MRRIILASASPRRKQLLEQVGLKFDIEVSDFHEVLDNTIPPHDLAKQLSIGKAQTVAKNHTDALIISADTIVILDGQVLGKPQNDDDARRILHMLSGKPHTVITGFTILEVSSGKIYTDSIATTVYFKTLTPEQINAYVATGYSLDKAGGYGIQEKESNFVERIDGDYWNVVGLPIDAVVKALRKFGVKIV